METLDLFDQVAVTWPEVYAWVEAVAGIPHDSPRVAAYIELWNVPGKVAAAKLAGTFEASVTAAPISGRPARPGPLRQLLVDDPARGKPALP